MNDEITPFPGLVNHGIMVSSLLPRYSTTRLLEAVRRVVLAFTMALVGMAFAGVTTTGAFAQVSVAPTGLFLSEQSRFGNVYISNGSQNPQQVEIQFQFGYPAADSTGSVYMNYSDSSAAEQYSLAPYLRAFPQQFSLPPGESQVVRVVANPLSDKPSGTYWTRMITASEPQVEEIDTTENDVNARVVFRLRQVTSVIFQKGQVSVDASLSDLNATIDSDTLRVEFSIDKSGNAPLLGIARIHARDSNGESVLRFNRTFAAYFDTFRTIDIPLDETDSSSISEVSVTVTTERSDIPSGFRVTMPEVTQSVSVTRK